ncbi:hypothetical protein TWF696_006618 [Orbilia brochopaga]|uniref:tyrosinase n=1 Tax=Orbilia brochopaga TaxID=3140254 RepID=A0AAV9UVM5_9PEZI
MAPTIKHFLVSALSLSSTYQFVNAIPFEGLDTPEDGLAKRATGWTHKKGEVANCAQYYYTHNNGETCDDILDFYKKSLSLTEAKLKKYNPYLVTNRCKLKRKEVYCVRVAGEKATPASAAPGPKAQAPVAAKGAAQSPAKGNAKTPAKGAAATDEDDDEDAKPSAKSSAKGATKPPAKGAANPAAKGAAAADEDDDEDEKPSKKTSTAPSASATAKVKGSSAANNASMYLPVDVVTAFNASIARTLNKYAIIGASISRASLKCVDRMEITDMEKKHPDTFNLLMLALNKMQTATSSDAYSYYQLSGIHGAPYVSWPVENLKPKVAYDTSTGYCVHRNARFGSWHRPYMLSFEQAIIVSAEKCLSEFTGESARRYKKAFEKLRWPFWDWARKTTQSHLPDCTKNATITVMKPNKAGTAVSATIDNPLYAYKFKNGENSFFKSPFVGVKQTSRRPAKALLPSNETAADIAMFSGYKTRRKQTYNALMSNGTFNSFSNDLEGIHNDVHVQCGGNGIMSYISYAAFEPLFWLHHNNIDRLMALWQAANPGKDSWLQPDEAVATYQRPIAKDVDDGDDDDDDDDDDTLEKNDALHKDTLETPMYPFAHADGTFWTADDVKDVRTIWKYNYGYPEVPCEAASMSDTELDDFTTEKINELYKDIPELDESTTAITTKGKGKNAKRSIEARKTMEWDANIVIDQSELCGTVVIFLFFGDPPSNTTLWDSCKKKIGTLTLLGAPKKHRMSKIEAATVPLTPALKKMGVKGTDDEVTAQLKKNLVWRCWNIDSEGVGREVPIKNLTTLKVAVTETKVIIPIDNTAKPVFGNVTLKTAVTEDKKGGVVTLKDIIAPKKKNGQRKAPRKGLVKIVDKKKAAKKAAQKKAGKKPGKKSAKKPVQKPAAKKPVAKKPAVKPEAKSPTGVQSSDDDAVTVTVTVTKHGSAPTGTPGKAGSVKVQPAGGSAKSPTNPSAKTPAKAPGSPPAKAANSPAKTAKEAENPPAKTPPKTPAKAPQNADSEQEGAGGGY